MSNSDNLFPAIKRGIEKLIEDQEGNVPSNKLLMLGSMIIVLGSVLFVDALAAHSSHSSHSSHVSHSSHSSSSTSTYTHSNHGSHESHVSHVSHTSHSNTSSHSNSLYSAEGDVQYSAPSAGSVPTVQVRPVVSTAETFVLPDVNQNIEVPSTTPSSGIMQSFAIPATSVSSKIDVDELHVPPETEVM